MGIKFHFLNVGSGDCTIIHFPERQRSDGSTKDERIMIVDMYHDSESDYTNVIEYYKNNFSKNGKTLPVFRFVCTHPHQDHICGLKEFFDDSGIEVINFWDVDHKWEPEDFSGHRTHEDDWKYYMRLRSGEVCKVLNLTADDPPGKYWDDDEDRITIINPTKEDIHNAHYTEDGKKRASIEIDEIAYALLFKINNRKAILAGDCHESPAWDNIVAKYSQKIANCSLLKAGHHGQESSFHEQAVALMKPKIIIFSNSEKCDKEEGAEKKYLKASPKSKIYKTFEQGNIVIDIPFGEDEEIDAYINN